MATSYFIIILYFIFFTLYSKTPTATSTNSSFSFNNFGQTSHFDSVLSLYGDAKVSTDGSFLQLTAPFNSSSGRVIYKNPVKFYSGIPKKLVSFSSYFSFTILSGSGNGNGDGDGDGDGLAFVVFSDNNNNNAVGLFNDDTGSFGVSNNGDLKFLSVEFDTLMDDKYGDMNGNHVGIDLSSFVSVKAMNLSFINLEVNSGDRLQVWIDYESMSRRLEVRVSKFGESRPVDPLLFEHVDLPKIWPENEGFSVGLSSSNRNSSRVCNVYSWSFKTRRSPDWMHSDPMDPHLFKQGEENEVKIRKGSDCVMRILSALILGIGLGALGAFVGMFVWTIFGKRQPISPDDYAANAKPKPLVVVVHDKASGNEKQ